MTKEGMCGILLKLSDDRKYHEKNLEKNFRKGVDKGKKKWYNKQAVARR